MNYYGDNDKKAAAWLRELIKAKLIPNGEVDERSICDVRPEDLKGFTQCHFFAGIGGWSYALQLAGWPESRPVWTGSCPCQDFSNMGRKAGHGGERNLWPEMFRLIRERRPSSVFGEQVESAIGYGWLDGIFVDLEATDYACGAAVLPAACVGTPQARHRLWWVAYAAQQQVGRTGQPRVSAGRMADTNGTSKHERASSGQQSVCEQNGGTGRLGHAEGQRLEGKRRKQGAPLFNERGRQSRLPGNAWSRFDCLPCVDGKARRIESGTFPLAHGIPARVGRLRGYGNAIVPEVACEFIQACEEVIGDSSCK